MKKRSALRAELVAAVGLPDEGRGWILPGAARARSIMESFRPDVVVSSGPPHSAHLVGRLATAGSAARWIVDLRDPWPHLVPSADRWGPLHATALSRLLIPLMERSVIGAADGVLANTRALRDLLAARYPHRPVVWVRNGFDPERTPPAPDSRSIPFRMCHLGTLYGNRSLLVVLEALRRFIDHHSLDPDGVRLTLAGIADEPHRAEVRDALSSLRLEDFVTVQGTLPGAEALRLLADSHLALVLAQGQQLQVPAKLYESLGMRIPTLVITEAGSATMREASVLGALVLEPHDVSGMTEAFERVFRSGGAPGPVPPPEMLYPGIARQVGHLLSDSGAFLLQAWSRPGEAGRPTSRLAGTAPPEPSVP